MIRTVDIVKFRVMCDGCSQVSQMIPGVYVADSHDSLRRDAAKLGWSTADLDAGVHDLCPLCSLGG